MENPWKNLPTHAPYVLAEDKPFIDVFNLGAPAHLKIRTNLMPEPFFGNRQAPVVILLNNPGYSEEDDRHHRNAKFRSSLRKDLASDVGGNHFLLSDDGPGGRWWQKRCRSMLVDVRVGEEVASNILTLEFFAYHSNRFGHAHLRLPSQEYTFDLLRRAMERQALIVCMRGAHNWLAAMPELVKYKNFKRHRNQSSYLTKANLGPVYGQILRAIGRRRGLG